MFGTFLFVFSGQNRPKRRHVKKWQKQRAKGKRRTRGLWF